MDILHSALATELVSYWPLDAVGSVVEDIHGPNDLTPINGPTIYNHPTFGNVLNLTRASAQYCKRTNAAQVGLDGFQKSTFSIWVIPKTALVHPKEYHFFNKWTGSSNADRAYIFGYVNWDNINYLRGMLAGGSQGIPSYVQTLAVGTPYHYALTFNGATGVTNMYLNGVLKSTVTKTPGTLAGGVADFTLGGYPLGSQYTDAYLFKAGFWHRDLSLSEIQSLYNGGTPLPYDAGTPVVSGANFFPFF